MTFDEMTALREKTFAKAQRIRREDVLLSRIIDTCVGEAMAQLRERSGKEIREKDVHEAALTATTLAVARLGLDGDGFVALLHERDYYKALAERALMLTPPRPIIMKT